MDITEKLMATGAIIFGTVAIFSAFEALDLKKRYSPYVDKVQQGYVAPSKIEKIAAKDLDKNGEPKTIMTIEGRNYLFKYDSKGIPTLVPYEVKVLEAEEKK